jgi:peptide chain release factor 1
MQEKEQALRTEHAELQEKLQDPSIYGDPAYPKLAKRQKQLEDTLALFDEAKKLEGDLQAAREMIESGGELAEMAEAEIGEIDLAMEKNAEALEEVLTPKDPNNDRDVIVEIRAAAGGDEASLFAAELYRMYVRWAENHNYKVEHFGESANDTGGFKEVSFAIRGDEAYKNLTYQYRDCCCDAGSRRNRSRDQRQRSAHRRLSSGRSWRTIREHHGLCRSYHSPPNRSRSSQPRREVTDQK